MFITFIHNPFINLFTLGLPPSPSHRFFSPVSVDQVLQFLCTFLLLAKRRFVYHSIVLIYRSCSSVPTEAGSLVVLVSAVDPHFPYIRTYSKVASLHIENCYQKWTPPAAEQAACPSDHLPFGSPPVPSPRLYLSRPHFPDLKYLPLPITSAINGALHR